LKTLILKINPLNIDSQKIEIAADVLRRGGIVAFPTETVYGLGANAFDDTAVHKIFDAKGRPPDNPLIVHTGCRDEVGRLVSEIPVNFFKLADRFWPGPLTLIMKKSRSVPDIITAGLDTVAVRIPSDPVALALIKFAGVPVAAPSANLSGKPSTTDIDHVMEDMYGRVDVIIDAGKVEMGIESTVLDITKDIPVILRPGRVTYEELLDVLGSVKSSGEHTCDDIRDNIPRAPGMKYTHYSPRAELTIVEGAVEDAAKKICELTEECLKEGKKVGILASAQTKHLYTAGEVIAAGDRDRPGTIAASLFSTLRKFDKRNVDIIFSEGFDEAGVGQAIMNRLRKAAGYRIIHV
jgi:L-threonylcarbamoyladenylate synthase